MRKCGVMDDSDLQCFSPLPGLISCSNSTSTLLFTQHACPSLCLCLTRSIARLKRTPNPKRHIPPSPSPLRHNPIPTRNRQQNNQHRQNPRSCAIRSRNLRQNNRIAPIIASRSQRRISLTDTALRRRHRRVRLADQIRLDDRECAHLLADAVRSVPDAVGGPLCAAGDSVGAAGALGGGGLGGGLDVGHYLVGEGGGPFGGGDDESGEVGFEAASKCQYLDGCMGGW